MVNAPFKTDELQNDLKNATVVAPVSGVVLQPLAVEGKPADMLAVGSRVSRGQTMFAIGDLETYSIRAKVDEIDINKIHVGQPVEVTGDAFDETAMHGTVLTVAAQAAGESATRGGMSTFPITVQISGMTAEQRARVHVGMSASVSIITYDNPDAVVIPPSALGEAGGKKVVIVQRDGRSVTTPVTLGISTPEGVEVRQGLKAGDLVQIGG